MGFYIETGKALGKAEYLIDNYDGQEILLLPASFFDIPENKSLICVVNNGFFEAAAYCFNEEELNAFKNPDGRFKRWILIDKDDAEKLSGYNKV